MNSKVVFRFLWAISILVMVALSCRLTSRAGELKATGEALATDIESGRKILGTGEAFATQIGESGIKETMQAVVTDIDESGLQETFQAVTTEIDQSGIKETLQAAATDLPKLSGDKPADIPVFEGQKDDLVSSAEIVSYISAGSFQEILDFYEREMPSNGWSKVNQDSSILENLANLTYQKNGRKAIILITHVPFISQTTVLITIQGG